MVLRAMDDSLSIQPRDMYWSVLGMMQNSWFRVVILKEAGMLRFEHPTQLAPQTGGWMERIKAEGGDLLDGNWGEKFAGGRKTVALVEVTETKMTNDAVKRTIGIEELIAHRHRSWFVVQNQVYDGAAYMESNVHPGGEQSVVLSSGLDVTEDFLSVRMLSLLRVFLIRLTMSCCCRFGVSKGNDARIPCRHVVQRCDILPFRDISCDP